MAVDAVAARLLIAAAVAGVLTPGTAVPARADATAYLVNVTVRPGYNFPNAEAALAYGNGLCLRINQGLTYPQLIGGVKWDFATDDEYQAVYLINQAANELCPSEIWQLRRVAVHYRGPTAPTPFP